MVASDNPDDGEPSRTSGMPTLEVPRGEGLKDICCVTTRYFGGTLWVRVAWCVPIPLRRRRRWRMREAGMIVEMTSVTPVDVTLD